ncbi:MAG TPA: DUF6438 domain-containing protein [Allocoleopsis sp.]
MIKIFYLTGILAGLSLLVSLAQWNPAFSVTPSSTSDPTPVPASSERDSLIITFERLGCFGFCPIYRLQIRGTGEVVYDGKENVEIEGQRTYQLSQQDVSSLIDAFDRANFWSLADRYEGGYTDAPAAIITITQAGTTKAVFHYSAAPDAPQALVDLEQHIDAIALPR